MTGPTPYVQLERDDDVPLARLSGEIDIVKASELGERLHDAVGNHDFGLVVDLREVTYLDSAGINLLFTLGDELRRRQQDLRLVIAGGSPIERMVSLTGLDRAVRRHTTVEEAVSRADGG